MGVGNGGMPEAVPLAWIVHHDAQDASARVWNAGETGEMTAAERRRRQPLSVPRKRRRPRTPAKE